MKEELEWKFSKLKEEFGVTQSQNREEVHSLALYDFKNFEHIAFWLSHNGTKFKKKQFVELCTKLNENDDVIEQFLGRIMDLGIDSKNIATYFKRNLDLLISYATAYNCKLNNKVALEVVDSSLTTMSVFQGLESFLIEIRDYTQNNYLGKGANAEDLQWYNYASGMLTISTSIPDTSDINHVINCEDIHKVRIQKDTGTMIRILNEILMSQSIEHLAISATDIDKQEMAVLLNVISNNSVVRTYSLDESTFNLEQKRQLKSALKTKNDIMIEGDIKLNYMDLYFPKLTAHLENFNKDTLLKSTIPLLIGILSGITAALIASSFIYFLVVTPIVTLSAFALEYVILKHTVEEQQL